MMTSAVLHHPAMLPYALAYARRGWPVFPLHTPTAGGGCSCGKPCGNPGKHPRTRNGFKQATTDEEIIRRWWAQWPDANIGLATGERSGVLAIDVDPKSGGAGTWQRVTLEHELPPLTITVDTGSGGWHFWFIRPSDRGVIKSRAGVIKPGVDTRCDGGYVVAPPSLHVSGRRYAFRAECDPAETDLATCPEWLIDLVAPQPQTSQKNARKPTTYSDNDGWLVEAFRAANWVRRQLGPDRYAVVCPWGADHSHPAGDNDSSTVVFRPTEGRTLGWFHCSHAHCSTRTQHEVLSAIPLEAKSIADRKYPNPNQGVATPDAQQQNTQDWQADLSRKASGDLQATIANTILILSNDEQWQGVLAHDAFAGRSVLLRQPPWYADDAPGLPHEALEDEDDIRLVAWLERRYSLRVGRDTARAALEVVCQRNAYHPVRDYLERCRDQWDGRPRLPAFAATYLGAADDAHYATAPLRWLVCAVRRVFEPGCQADSILVLEGKQGIGKSKFLRLLFSDQWFADEIGDPGNKDAADALRGKWCIEIGELRWRKSDEETRKAFISRRVDHYRPAYGRRTVDVPRQCVLAASTNEHDWQTDPTGARRYWAVRCGDVDHAAVERDRDQFWGEAVVRYEAGEPSWLQADEVPAQMEALEQRRESDPWEGRIAAWLSTREEAAVPDVMADCLGIEPAKQGLADSRRVGRVMRTLGWEISGKKGPRGARVKVWSSRSGTRQ